MQGFGKHSAILHPGDQERRATVEAQCFTHRVDIFMDAEGSPGGG